MYGSKVHAYNFEGRTNLNSTLGVICSIIVNILTIKFLTEKTIIMVLGSEPAWSTAINPNVHTEQSEHVNLDRDGIFLAVGVRNYLENTYKDHLSTTREG